MVSRPGKTPVIKPVDGTAVALLLLLLHTPPASASVSVMLADTQTLDGPLIAAGVEEASTTTVAVLVNVPHGVVTI